jgi:hypothetical protein
MGGSDMNVRTRLAALIVGALSLGFVVAFGAFTNASALEVDPQCKEHGWGIRCTCTLQIGGSIHYAQGRLGFWANASKADEFVKCMRDAGLDPSSHK